MVQPPSAYGFFTSPTDLLGGLTTIEVTLGRLTSGSHLIRYGITTSPRSQLSITSPDPYPKLVDDMEWKEFLAANPETGPMEPH